MKKNDRILFVCAILLSCVFLLLNNDVGNKPGDQLVIRVDGRIYGTYDLVENQMVEIKNGDFYNRISISNGKVSMEEADCPDGYCVKHDKIEKENQTIVCLPHKLVAEIILAEVGIEENGVDAVVK